MADQLSRSLLSRAVITIEAARVLAQIRDKYGPVMFHQSGGCCEGSGPSCFRVGSYIVSPLDRLLGIVTTGEPGDPGTPVWISASQYAAWEHTQVVIDVTPGMGMGGFSLEGTLGYVFLSRGRVFTEDELARLEVAPRRLDLDRGEATAPEAMPPVDLEGDFGTVCALPKL